MVNNLQKWFAMEDTLTGREHQLLLDAIKDHAIFMIDPDGHIASWNEGAKRLKGYEDDEVLGKHFRFLFLPEDQKGRPERELQKALDTGKFEEEWWRLRKDGSKFWAHVILQPVFDKNNKHIGFAKITTDKTEQKRINELNTFLMDEVAGYAIFLLDKGGKVAKWSKAAENIMGYTAQEILGQPMSILYPSSNGNGVAPAHHVSATLHGKHDDEGWKVRKDGSHFWANYVITPLHNSDGHVVLIRDLTEKRALEQASKANIALSTSNKELERFAHIASHDLKEPIRKVSVFCSLLVAESPAQQKLVDKILNACQRVLALIDDILEFSSSAKNLPFVRQDLTVLVQQVLESLDEVLTEKKAIVRFGPMPVALVVPSQMAQLFQNLISNAIKFCCLGDQTPMIVIESEVKRKEDLEPELLNDLMLADHYLQISVSDNGIGFDQQHANTIFDLFRRLHGRSEFEGTGVGLSICKKVAENHGGDIRAFSEKGEGARFVVTLPHIDLED